MSDNETDVAIVGGGLAGLASAILFAQKGYSVILFEKNEYPFHRVCGEYISLESLAFLKTLGIDATNEGWPMIEQLTVTSSKGAAISHRLPLGGFGVSRFLLDFELAKLARTLGVTILEKTTVTKITSVASGECIETNQNQYKAKFCLGAFGKRSNIDIVLQRPFVKNKPNKLNNFVGVKYHVQIDLPRNHIFLHNFQDGYCGISAIENDTFCLCYMTTAQNLKNASNNIKTLENNILSQNQFLHHIFAEARFLEPNPTVIAQISFERKSFIENNIFMIGDTAGMIPPLCGNGMSMALHSAKMIAEIGDMLLKNRINLEKAKNLYQYQWQRNFAKRLWVGRQIQKMFGSESRTELLIKSLNTMPSAVMNQLIKYTHGVPF